jgi:hypothetical protein
MRNSSVFILITLLACSASSCKKSTHAVPDLPDTPVQQVLEKVYLPQKLESKNLSIKLGYKAGTNLLTEVSGSDGYKTIISYTSMDRPLKLEKYKNDKLTKLVDYRLDKKQRIVQCNLFSFEHGEQSYTPLGDIELEYDEHDRVLSFRFYDDQQRLTQAFVPDYDKEGNLSSMQSTAHPGNNMRLDYTYDKQPGIYQELPFVQIFSLELEECFFSHQRHNVLQRTASEQAVNKISYSYTYNKAGLPVDMVINEGKKNRQFTITYEERTKPISSSTNAVL